MEWQTIRSSNFWRIHDSTYEYMCCWVETIRMFTHGTKLFLSKCTNVSVMEWPKNWRLNTLMYPLPSTWIYPLCSCSNSYLQLQQFVPSHMIPYYFWPNTSIYLLWSSNRFVFQILERIHDTKYEYMCCGVETIRMFTHGTMLVLAKCTNVSIMEQQTMRSPNIWIYQRRKICMYLFWNSNDLYVCITHPTRCGVYDVTNLHIRSNFHVFWLHYPTSISWKSRVRFGWARDYQNAPPHTNRFRHAQLRFSGYH